MAVPEADGYDTSVIAELRAPSLASWGAPPFTQPVGPVWFKVAPIYAERPDFLRDFGDYPTAQGVPPTVPPATQLVDCWPTGGTQARALIRVLHAAYEPAEPCGLRLPDLAGAWDVVASSSHSYADAFGTLWATVDSPVGLAEAIVHEMAHHKLRTLGVTFEHADRIVANHASERYPSAILDGRLRPMPALLHAHYALLHMLALELEILSVGPALARPVTVALLHRHQLLLRSGDSVLWPNLIVDEIGAQFLPPLRRWQSSLFERSEIYR